MIDFEAVQIATLVTKALDRLSVPYVIGGSLASIIHGMSRTTLDIDIVADIRPHHVPAFVTSLQDAFYLDEPTIHKAIAHRSSFNLIHPMGRKPRRIRPVGSGVSRNEQVGNKDLSCTES